MSAIEELDRAVLGWIVTAKRAGVRLKAFKLTGEQANRYISETQVEFPFNIHYDFSARLFAGKCTFSGVPVKVIV